MNENLIAKGEAQKLKLGFVLNFSGNPMKDGIERVVNGLPEETLGVLASWRDTLIKAEPVTAPDAAPPHSGSGVLIHHVLKFACQECSNIFYRNPHQSQARCPRSPGLMWGDNAVFGTE